MGNNNAALRCQQLRTGIGPGGSSMDENAGTRESRCFRNHRWSGLRSQQHNRLPMVNLQAYRERSLAIRWIQWRGHRLIRKLSTRCGVTGWNAAEKPGGRKWFAPIKITASVTQLTTEMRCSVLRVRQSPIYSSRFSTPEPESNIASIDVNAERSFGTIENLASQPPRTTQEPAPE